MTKNDRQHALVPRLRFPEFRDEPGWKTYRLVDLADPNVRWSFMGGPFGSNLKASDYTSEGVRIIQLQNIGDGEFLNEYKIYTSPAKADELLSCNAYPEEIILSKMGDPVGRACITPTSESRYLMCSDGIRLVVDENRFDKLFVFLSINFEIFRQRVESAATGSTRKRIGLDTLRQLPLEIPDRAEQQKIADCLGSLDDLIAAEWRKLTCLWDHKKGLMQQLFPREGETRPRLRFPEFRDKGDWEEKAIGTLGYFTGGGTPSKENEAYWTGDIPWISSSDLTEESIFQINVSRFITEQAVQESATKLVPAHSILLISRVGVGKLAISTFPLCTSQDFTNFTPTNANPLFLAYLLKSRKESLLSFNQGTSIKGFTKDNIATLVLGFPSAAEQQRIADCLSALDTLIAAQAEKLDALRTHKRGLMQQLFPSPEDPEV